MTRRSPEATLQRDVCRFLKHALPDGWGFWMNLNNPRSAINGAQMKAMGLLKGVPDMSIAGPSATGARTLYIELKAPKGRLTPEQTAFLDWWSGIGGFCAVCRSVDDVEAFLKDSGLRLRATVGGA